MTDTTDGPICVSCGHADPTTHLRVNPYKDDVLGDSTPELLCDGCTAEAAGDI